MDIVSDYLEKNPTVNAYLKDAVTLMLECRPLDPLAFLSEYFANPNASKSYRYIRLSQRARHTFWDHTYAAFLAAEGDSPGSGVSCIEFSKLLRMVCADFPDDVWETVMVMHKKCVGDSGTGKDSETTFSSTESASPCSLTFYEFAAGVNACIQCGTLVQQIIELAKSIDSHGGSKNITKSVLVSVIESTTDREMTTPQSIAARDQILERVLRAEGTMIPVSKLIQIVLDVCTPLNDGSNGGGDGGGSLSPHEMVSTFHPMGRCLGAPKLGKPKATFVQGLNTEGRYLLPT
eukprot:PhF_6_TR12253/c0_g1_i1/m.19417